MQGRTSAGSPDPEFDADVVIVGFGPVGVTAALLLAHYGIRAIAIERERGIYPRARAVTVNDWTLRIYQSAGLDEQLKADMFVNGALQWKTYSGKEVFKMGTGPAEIGHPPSMMIYQPAMEATLREAVAQHPDLIEVRFGEQVTGVTQDDTGATVTVTDVKPGGTAPGEERTLRARYVLACDGGSSRVRVGLGVNMLGSTLETDWIVIDAEVLRWWPGCNELVFWSDPQRPVVDIPLAMGNHRWEFPLRPHENKEDFDSPEAIWALLTPMGITPEHVRIKQHAFYVHHVRHAETWRVGRVLLLGDAAHLMPPWAGQGMQSGIRDAQNVAWKLREILAGRLDDSILDTYQAERAPHVAAVTEMSTKLGVLIASQDRKFVAVRNTLGPVLKHLTFLTRVLLPAATTPKIDGGWLRGTPGKRSAVGRMIPQPEVCTANGRSIRLDEALGDGFVVLGRDVDPRGQMTGDQVAGWEALGARFIAVRPASGAAIDDSDLIDHGGALTAWMNRYHAVVIAVRPDRFVAATEAEGLETPTPAVSSTTQLTVLSS